jgi:hypothetical protein
LTRITNADQVLLLLKSHLQRAQRGERKPASAPLRSSAQQTPLERVQNLVRQDDLPESEIGRALVRGLLSHEFGASVSNDAEFQAILDDVLATIRRDETTSRLLNRAIAQLTEQ